MSDLQSILEGSIDLYNFLGVAQDASTSEIRSNYRRLALQFHPDKNEGSTAKFTLLSQVYQILSNDDLKNKYDHIRSLQSSKDIEISTLRDSISRFKADLERDELLARKAEAPTSHNLDLLQREGLQKRRDLERNLRRQNNTDVYVSFDQISVPHVFSITKSDSDELLVKWKHKDELQGLFNEDVLRQIMSIFGPLKSCRVLPEESGSRYDAGVVEYTTAQDSEKALNHDYKHSATIWDGTNVRKLASLLRECKPLNGDALEEAVNNFCCAHSGGGKKY